MLGKQLFNNKLQKKMKYKIIYSAMVLCLSVKAQVGVNTNNPQGIFHIDTRGNNAVTGNPSASEMTDDIVVDRHTTSGVNMTVGGKVATNSSAQLSLLDPHKAMLFNRVALKNVNDIETIPNPLTGTFVYNTATAGTFPNDVVPAFYYFNGIVWYKVQTGVLESDLSQKDLLVNCTSTATTQGLNNSGISTIADFGQIKIEEQGTYLFSLRLYGRLTNSTGLPTPGGLARTVFYIFLTKNSNIKLDSAIINVPSSGTGSGLTHTTVMQATLNVGDVVNIRMAHNSGTYGFLLIANPGISGIIGYPQANKTSLIYWKV